jgi:hypothetical protein
MLTNVSENISASIVTMITKIIIPFSELKMEAVCSSETLVSTNKYKALQARR